jgi:hypothetical protein
MKPPRLQLWIALAALAAGAALLHLRVHPPTELTYLWPNLFSWLDLVAVSLLFLSRHTALPALILNSFIAFLGIIMMADYSLSATLAGQLPIRPGADFFGWLLLTTLPDLAILVADFFLGLAFFKVTMQEP